MKVKSEIEGEFHQSSDLPVFFILGKGRSGSTLLQLLLDAHPAIKIPPESRFFIYLFNKYVKKKIWKKRTLLNFYNDLFLDDKLNYLWEIDRENLKNEILSQPKNTDFGKLFKLVNFQSISIFKKEEIKLIGDKNPVNSLFIDQLTRVFPEAKFIHLVRDPRATSLSHVQAFAGRNLSFASLEWRKHNLAIEKAKTKFPAQFFTLRYEDLVEEPKNYLKMLTQFLAIDFKPEMLNYYEAVNKEISLKIENKNSENVNNLQLNLLQNLHKNLLKPINKDALYKWKTALKASEIKKIEAITGELMLRYNYSPKFEKEAWENPSKGEIFYFNRRMLRLRLYYGVPFFLRKAHTKYIKKGTNLPDF